MRIRLRRGELAIIAVTLMFACFIGGYFTGRRGSVNIVPVVPPYESDQSSLSSGSPSSDGSADSAGASTPDSGSSPSADAPGGGPSGGEDADASEQPQESPGAPRDTDGKININTASRSELMDLSGIGQTLAARIIEYRESHGPFAKIDDLMKVSGIGEKRFEAIQDKITVG